MAWGLKRLPSQSGQRMKMSAMKCISIFWMPLPVQDSHRPPAVLNEKCPGP